MEIPVIWWSLLGLALALLVTVYCVVRLLRQIRTLRHQLRSFAVKKGQMAEQFLPLIESYPWDPQNFRFLGSPVDGIAFEQDKVIIVEFKTGRSQLNPNQKHIRKLVSDGKVDFQEIRIS